MEPLVGDDLLHGCDHLLGGFGEQDVGDRRSLDQQIAVRVAILGVDHGDVRLYRGHQHQFLAGEGAGHGLVFGVHVVDRGAADRAHRHERQPQNGGPQLLDHGIAAAVIDIDFAGFAGPAVIGRHAEILLEAHIALARFRDCSAAAEQIDIDAVGRAHHVEIAGAAAEQGTDDRHRLAR